MKSIAMICTAILISLPTAVLAQSDAASPGMETAPKGHLPPKPGSPPKLQGGDNPEGASQDDPAKLDQRLEPSNDAAIHSLCSYCLKPEGGRKKR